VPERNPDAPPDPERAFAERRRQAIDSRIERAERASVDGAGVDGAAPPPKARSAAPASSSTQGDAAPPASDPSPAVTSTSSVPKKDAPEAEATSSESPAGGSTANDEKAHRYELKSLKRWAEENPEQAQEFAQVLGVEPKEGFIKLQNKRRRIREEQRQTHEKNLQIVRSVADQAKADREKAEQVAGEIRWVTDMWSAGSRKNDKGEAQPDFDMIDEAFRRNTGGLSVDDYMRLRARRGVSSPELARERAQRMQAEQELQRLKGGQSNGAAAPTPPGAAAPANGAGAANGAAPAPAAPPAPAQPAAPSSNPEETWGEEVPADHQLRQFAGWAADLDKEMQRHYDRDLDEYDIDPEEVADSLLKRRLAALTGQQEQPAAAPAPAGRQRPKTPKTKRQSALPTGSDGLPDAAALTPKGGVPRTARPGHREGVDPKSEDFEGNWAKVQARALERHYARMRGEHVD
jgi:hypothetical protein